MGKTACITGHRPSKLSFGYDEDNIECQNLKALIRAETERLIRKGYTHFISGMALGVDMWFAEIIIELKNKYDIILEAAIPFEGQEKKWPKKSQERYNKIREKADIVTVLSRGNYSNYLMIKRDEYMVDKSNILIACYNGSPGGTMHTFSYAIDRGVNIIHINPNTKTVRYIKNKS